MQRDGAARHELETQAVALCLTHASFWGSSFLQKIIALIAEMGVRIKQILVTHAHFDHFLAAEEIRKHTGAPVGLCAADNLLWQALPLQCMMLGQPAPKTPVGAPDFDLVDGMTLAVRDGRVIHTPGHSAGSCCFYFPGDALVCTGDTLFRQSVGRTDLMGGDSAALVRSIQQRLYTLPHDTHVIPGHGPTTDIGFEAKHNSVVKAAQAASL
jgi:glyoxylase-like metal-dependent hydrolase (beta-lactamase superfamily II)